jgi:hypothetical protein
MSWEFVTVASLSDLSRHDQSLASIASHNAMFQQGDIPDTVSLDAVPQSGP